MQFDLLSAYEKGQKLFVEFVNSRLLGGTTGFFELLQKLKLQTFASLSKKEEGYH